MSPTAQEVLRQVGRRLGVPLAFTATLQGWGAMVSSSQAEERAQRWGARCPCGSCFSHGSPL